MNKLKAIWKLIRAKNYLVITETNEHSEFFSHDTEPNGGLVTITAAFVDDMFDYDELDQEMDAEIKDALKHRLN